MCDCSVTPARCPLGADRNILTQRHRCRSSNQPAIPAVNIGPRSTVAAATPTTIPAVVTIPIVGPPTLQRVAKSTSNPHGVQQDEMEFGTSVTVDAKTAGRQEI